MRERPEIGEKRVPKTRRSVSERAEPQEGGIALGLDQRSEGIPGISMRNDGAGCLRGQWWLHAVVLLKFWVFVINT